MRKLAVLAVALGAVAADLSGCGGDDSEARTAPESCQDFLDAWCNKSAECAAPSERARAREDCLFVSQLDINCSHIAAVGATFPQCMADIAASHCVPPDGFISPSSCGGILIRN